MESRKGQVLVLSLHLHHTRKEAQACDSSVCNKFSSLLLSLTLAFHWICIFPQKYLIAAFLQCTEPDVPKRNATSQSRNEMHEIFYPSSNTLFSYPPHNVSSCGKPAQCSSGPSLTMNKKVVPKTFPPLLSSFRTGLT